MTDLEALHRAILDHPDDDTPRLIYADALEDVGESDRAAMIRAQVELARVPDSDPFAVRCRTHNKPLVTGVPWMRELPELPEGLDWALPPFRRGFPAAVQTRNGAAGFTTHADRLFAEHPIESLEVDVVQANQVVRLAGCKWLSRITQLTLRDGLGQSIARRVLGSEHLTRLTELHVGARLTTPSAALAVFESAAFKRLTAFSYREDRPYHSVITGLARLADPPRLRRLNLSGNRATAEHVARLVAAPALMTVEELDLGENNLGPEGVAAVAAAQLPLLRSLHLMQVRPGEEGVRTLAGSELLAGLRSLSLNGNNLGPGAAAALAGSAGSANLRALDLRDNRLGDRGAASLANSPHLANLLHLDLSGNEIEDAGADALAESPHLGGLIALELAGNLISPRAAARLRKRFGERVFT
jgi:uncharacterized protein (TIGR02996 family)